MPSTGDLPDEIQIDEWPSFDPGDVPNPTLSAIHSTFVSFVPWSLTD